MTTSIMDKKLLHTSKYVIEHIIHIPSKMGDYDYDPSNPNRRFISGYIHNLVFKDNITDAILSSITFSSIECVEIINALYKVSFANENNSNCAISIDNIHISGLNSVPGTTIIFRLDDSICMSVFTSIHDRINFSFYPNEILSFIQILENDILDDLYVIYSSDR